MLILHCDEGIIEICPKSASALAVVFHFIIGLYDTQFYDLRGKLFELAVI